MNSEPTYVIDTHPLIWYLAGSPKLKPAARRALTRIERGTEIDRIPSYHINI